MCSASSIRRDDNWLVRLAGISFVDIPRSMRELWRFGVKSRVLWEAEVKKGDPKKKEKAITIKIKRGKEKLDGHVQRTKNKV
jgi:hypothetical protein